MTEELQVHVCTRCGGEAPIGFHHYIASIAPGITGWNVKANANPVKFRKGGMCRRCTLAIVQFIGAGMEANELMARIARLEARLAGQGECPAEWHERGCQREAGHAGEHHTRWKTTRLDTMEFGDMDATWGDPA